LCLVYATTVVIYYLADFVHIWYNGWVWSEHVHIIPSCIHKTQKWTIPIRHIKDPNSGKNQPTVRWIHIGMSYCSFHVDILKIHHFVCICSKDFNSVNSYIKHIQCIFNPQRGSKF
jgi:hypothetical protein